MRGYLRDRLANWIRRRQGLDSLPLTLQRRRLYILPTRAGIGFALLLLLMLIAGLNYANSMALFLTFLLIAFTLVAMHRCHRNLLGATIVAATAHPTFAGHAGNLHLTFGHPGATPRYRIAAGVADAPPVAIDLHAQTPRRLELTVPTSRRGLLRIDRIRLLTTHPFGMFRTWTWVHAPIAMLVYPRPLGSLPMPGHEGQKSGMRSLSRPGSEEWLGLRPFRDGDSPRQVDWKAYAREAPLLVKEYSTVGSQLRVFHFASLATLSVEARLEQLARWVVDAESQGERYGLILPEIHLKPDRGPGHRHRCLAALAVHADDSATG